MCSKVDDRLRILITGCQAGYKTDDSDRFGQRVSARRDSGIIDSIFPENVGSGLMTYG